MVSHGGVKSVSKTCLLNSSLTLCNLNLFNCILLGKDNVSLTVRTTLVHLKTDDFSFFYIKIVLVGERC